jgi:hypothetical protein
MRTVSILMLLALGAPGHAAAQQAAAPPPAEMQIRTAIAPLPEQFRADATVLGYRAGAPGLAELRSGTGAFVCLADDPADDRFHAACYHRSLEPFMARGRALRAEGRGAEADSVRAREIRAGTLAMPSAPTTLYSLTGPAGSVEWATGEIRGARPLYVVYLPYATAESTGLPTRPVKNAPWLMFPGTAKAHIMFVPEM